MNIFLHELKNLRFTTIIWSAIIIFILLLFFVLYPSYYDNKDMVLSSLKDFSDESLLALGINKETLFTPLGYYSFSFVYITIIAALQAGILGFKIMINDFLESSSEFLLTKPIPRKKILNRKVAAGITSLLFTHVLYQIISIILVYLIKGNESISLSQLFLINLSLLLIQITFLSICMMIGAYIKKPKAIIITSIITILGFYILSIVENIIDNVLLRYINPFSYFKASDILLTGGYKQSFVIATVFIAFFCLNFSYGCYENDDILGE